MASDDKEVLKDLKNRKRNTLTTKSPDGHSHVLSLDRGGDGQGIEMLFSPDKYIEPHSHKVKNFKVLMSGSPPHTHVLKDKNFVPISGGAL